MKLAVWDILAIFTLVAMCVMGLIFIQILANPYSPINPFPPVSLPATIVLPSTTATLRSLPATWTPDGEGIVAPRSSLAPSQTAVFTSTGFVLASFTPSATITPTPTITRTPTPTYTRTNTPDYTSTALSKIATAAAQTQSAQQTVAAGYSMQTAVAASQTAIAAQQTADAQGTIDASVAQTASAAQATADCQALIDAGNTCP